MVLACELLDEKFLNSKPTNNRKQAGAVLGQIQSELDFKFWFVVEVGG